MMAPFDSVFRFLLEVLEVLDQRKQHIKVSRRPPVFLGFDVSGGLLLFPFMGGKEDISPSLATMIEEEEVVSI